MKGDLHVHSKYSSDGKQTVEQILERCHALGLEVVAITDHNQIQGSLDALRENRYGMIVLTGTEITSVGGHILAYNIFEPVPRGRSVEETIDLIHSMGGIAVAAHPFRIWSGLGRKNVTDGRFDAVETLNARSLNGGNARASRLALDLGLPEIGGSDAHISEAIGRSYTVFPDGCASADDLVKAIKNNEARPEGTSRPLLGSFSYGTRSITGWFTRGFRRL